MIRVHPAGDDDEIRLCLNDHFQRHVQNFPHLRRDIFHFLGDKGHLRVGIPNVHRRQILRRHQPQKDCIISGIRRQDAPGRPRQIHLVPPGVHHRIAFPRLLFQRAAAPCQQNQPNQKQCRPSASHPQPHHILRSSFLKTTIISEHETPGQNTIFHIIQGILPI